MSYQRYRAPLLTQDGELSDNWRLLVAPQRAKLAAMSIQTDRSVMDLLREAKFMVEECGDNEVILEGFLPHCQLYGCILPDGSSHT